MSTAHDEVDTSEPPVSVPDTGDAGESGKLKMIVSLVKKCFGVKDIASMRLSLPASLLEPIPNLEYWHYLDRPDLFTANHRALSHPTEPPLWHPLILQRTFLTLGQSCNVTRNSINDSDDAFERMMAVLRFTFSKDLKFIHGKVCKPYNSVIGEHFRAHWDVLPVSYPEGNRLQMPVQHLYLAPAAAESVYSTADSSSVKSGVSGASGLSRKPGSQKSTNGRLSSSTAASGTGTPTNSTPATSAIEEIDAELEQLSLDPNAAQKLLPPSEREKLKGLPGNVSMSSVQLVEEDSPVMSPVLNGEPRRLRTSYLTEQISHHPPVSAFHASCPSRHLSMCGIDQISAKVSGTTVRVAPGQYNKGIFLHVEDRLSEDGKPERYHITHPPAHVNGILRGSFYITVSESTYVTCTDGPAWVVPGGKDKGKRVGLRAVVDYKEESWIGKANFLLDAVVHTYDLDNAAEADAWTKVKHVPRERVVATLAGSWRHLIKYKLNPAFFPTRTGSTLSLPADEWVPLIDLSMLYPIPKLVRDLEKQEDKESRRMWQNVTDRLLRKEYSEANKFKQAIEQRQREEEAARKQSGEKYVPKYFVWDVDTGLPTLTEAGKKALEEEMKEQAAHPLEQ